MYVSRNQGAGASTPINLRRIYGLVPGLAIHLAHTTPALIWRFAAKREPRKIQIRCQRCLDYRNFSPGGLRWGSSATV